MTKFTTDNTENYSIADLAVLNEAHDRVMSAQALAGCPDDDGEYDMDPEMRAAISESLGDALHNAWLPGSTASDLIARLDRSWGI